MMAIRLQQVGDHHIMSPQNGSRRDAVAATHSVGEFSNAAEATHQVASTQAQIIPTVIGGSRALELYDPERGLKEIVLAETAEKHWKHAKDASKLYEAIKAKLTAQAQYVVWRDSVVQPSQEAGSTGRKGGNRISDLKSDLPTADPGAVVIHRWRKRLCTDA